MDTGSTDTATPAGAPPGTAVPPLSRISRVAYGLGDFASQLVWTMAGSYLAIFYTDSVGLSAGLVGMVIVVARVLDAVIDPVLGILAERTRSRYGRFRPWLLYGTPVLAALSVLTYTAPFGGTGATAVLWAVVTYGLLGFAYSAVNMPYGALITVMTGDSAERVSLASARMVGTSLGNVLLGMVSLPMILFFSGVGDGETRTVHGYTLTALVMAVIAVPLFYLVFGTSREVIVPVHAEKVPVRSTMRAMARNRDLLMVLLNSLFQLTGFFGRVGVLLYYLLYAVGDYGKVSFLMTAPFLTMALGIVLFSGRAARRFGKRNAAIIGNAASGVVLLVLYLVGPGNVWVVLGLQMLYGLACFGSPIGSALLADSIDHGEVTEGVRADGTSYAMFSFASKVASAAGGAVGVVMLGWFGYVANAQQSAHTIDGINLVVNVFPAALALLSVVPLFFYRLTDDDARADREILDARTAEAAAGATGTA